MSAPNVDYLSATLELIESARGEMTKLLIRPFFDEPRMEIEIEECEAEDPALIILNRRQIECLADFLAAWLSHAPATSADGSTAPMKSG